MSVPILIIDNNTELQVIEKQHPGLTNASLVLLSSNFSPQQLELYRNRGYLYFDQLTTKEDGIRMAQESNHLVWNWFIDEDGNDLSLIEGCSLGSAFVSSLEILLSSVLRYQTGLKKILNEDHVVYFSSQTDNVFQNVILDLQKDIEFNLITVETSRQQLQETYGKNNLIIDAGGRYRDLYPIFRKGRLREKLISKILQIFQKNNNNKLVLFMPGGKHQSYFKYLHEKNGSAISWMIPFNRVSKLFSMNSSTLKYYYFLSIGDKQTERIGDMIAILKDNIKKQTTAVEPELLIKLMELYVFNYFVEAFNYYLNALSTFKKYRPLLTILSGENYETYILVAQAAKKEKLQTAITSHGLNCNGYEKYKKGTHQVFDYALAYGQQDLDNYKLSGVNENNIAVSSFPYFERFLPLPAKNKTKIYKKVLLLSLDMYNHVPLEKAGAEYQYYREIVELMDELNIEIVGIKARHIHSYRNLGVHDNILEINSKRITLICGYSTFPDAVKSADFVIGPASTACIESGLLGKDYYTYQHTAFHEYAENVLPSLFDYVNASFNMNQLRENILKKQPYKEGCSVNDLIDLSSVKTKEDLYEKYESGIQEILDDIEYTNTAKIESK